MVTNSSQMHERHCRGYIDRAVLTPALAGMRGFVPMDWEPEPTIIRIAVRRLVSGNLGPIQCRNSDTSTAPVTRGSDGTVAGLPIITVRLVALADHDR